ncbi:hypothetical protein [Actinomadura sp. 9N215]|uniref:hypothetical protein n=1 Tax=Actinomadura sp. 9N215 TaxID=3375150 RepID=UPI0037946F25
MNKRHALTALAATTAIPLTVTPATATAAQPTRACSTWQYVTDPGKPIYNGRGTSTGVKDYTRNNGFINATNVAGDWRTGTFYTDPGPDRYATGSIHISHVHYVRCW